MNTNTEINSFQELISIPFQGEINAICLKRGLKGNFKEIVDKLNNNENIVVVDINELLELDLSGAGQTARNLILDDYKLLEAKGAAPVLNIINAYPVDNEATNFRTDVYSFHVDSSPIESDTFLCTYYGAASEILLNKDAILKISIPSIRAELKKIYDISDADFEKFASDYFFDLHYEAKPGAEPVNLGIGNLWRLAVKYPNARVLPCIHRAPEENGTPRLMMIC